MPDCTQFQDPGAGAVCSVAGGNGGVDSFGGRAGAVDADGELGGADAVTGDVATDAPPACSGGCDDGNVCTKNECQVGGLCAFPPQVGACDDGDACTVADACAAGKCAGVAKVCNDGDPCTEGDKCAGGACFPGKNTCPKTESDCGNKVDDDKDGHTDCGDADCGVACATVLIPAGKFLMGCVPGDAACSKSEKPQHEVYLDAYYIDVTEVTVAAYEKCVDAGKCGSPSTTDAYCSGSNAKYNNWDVATGKGKVGRVQHPVNCVTWTQAKDYCEKMIPKGRLQTEAEWEKAARGGLTDKKYPWGDQDPTCTPGQPNTAVWSSGGVGCGKDSTWPVGTDTSQNGYGLYDMSGNVWEWVSDAYDSYPNPAPTLTTNPCNKCKPDDFASNRVVRGGSFGFDIADYLRASERDGGDPSDAYVSVGFRCTRSLP